MISTRQIANKKDGVMMMLPRKDRRRMIQGASALIGGLITPGLRAQDEYGDSALRGAGSTFVQPLMEAWVGQYRSDPFQVMQFSRGPEGGLGGSLSNDRLDYEPVGSLAGIQRIRAGSVDFAASEMPLGTEFLRREGLMQFPWVAGGVAVVATAFAGSQAAPTLQLDASTLASIFLGKITSWSDRAIASQNPGVRLPDAPIAVLHRSDGSGTTFTFSNYLSRNDDDWKQRLGSDLLLKWPVGSGRKGSDAIVQALKSTPRSIGYVNAVQARQAGLPIIALRNQAGLYVLPEARGIAAALEAPSKGSDDLARLPIDAPGDASYPLVATVFGLMKDPIRSTQQRRAANFVAWTMTRGAGLADRLGYRNLPEAATKATLDWLGSKA